MFACGTCDAELSTQLWQGVGAPLPPGWTPAISDEGWQLGAYRDLSPESYESYLDARARCEWKSTGTLATHNWRVATDAGHSYAPNVSGTDRRIPFMSAPTKVCVLPPEYEKAESGSWTQWVITRVENITFGRRGILHSVYKQWGFYSNDNIDVNIAKPKPSGRPSKTFVVQTINTASSMLDEQPLAYPPLHTHHVNTFLGGKGAGPRWLRNFSVFIGTVHGMRHADFYECMPGVEDPNACSLIRLDKGAGKLGYSVTDYQYEHSVSLFNIVGEVPKGYKAHKNMVLEFGRKYTVEEEGTLHARKPLYGFDMSINGCGDTFIPRASLEGSISVAWRVFQKLPTSLKFHSSWLHTHAQLASEVFVLEGDIEKVLPLELVAACYASEGSCEVASNGQRGQRRVRGVEQRDMSLQQLGLTAASVLKHVMAGSSAITLRCQYKSRNVVVNGVSYTRSAARTTASARTCDDWTVSAGSHISILVFSHPLASSRNDLKVGKAHPQHIRWYANAELLE